MDHSRTIWGLIGFSTSIFFFCRSNLRKRERRQLTTERLRLVSEALREAEERAARLQERHDRILNQICMFYLSNKELEEALAGARAAMNEASENVVTLRRMKMKIITSFPDDVDFRNVIARNH